jgi:hypothetical protein
LGGVAVGAGVDARGLVGAGVAFAVRGLTGAGLAFAVRGLTGAGLAFAVRGFAGSRVAALGFFARAFGAVAALTTAGSWACAATGGAPVGAGRLLLRRWGRVRGRDPITPGSGSSVMRPNHGAQSGIPPAAKKFVLSLKRRGRSEV